MIRLKKMPYFLGALFLVSAFLCIPSFAEEQITAISVNVNSTFNTDSPVAETPFQASVNAGAYTITGHKFTNQETAWNDSSTPRLELYLETNSGYEFYNISSPDVTLTGDDATLSGLSHTDNQHITLTISYKPLSQSINVPGSVTWTHDYMLTWAPVSGAGEYELTFYRNSTRAFTINVPATTTTYNFHNNLHRPFNYKVMIRAIRQDNPKIISGYATSPVLTLTQSMANAIKAGKIGWKQDDRGWFYYNSDGTYPSNAWKTIDDKSYYFDADGYMMTNTTTPDGYHVDENGVWIP